MDIGTVAGQQRQHRLDVQLGRGHQCIDQWRAVLQYHIGGRAGALVDLADQRIAVGMRAGRGNADQHVTLGHGRAVQQLVLLDGGHREAGQVVFPGGVHVRHFRRLAADQRTAGLHAAFSDTADHRRGGVHVQLAGGKVVQEEQRLGALYQHIVDTHGHQVDADGVVPAQLLGQLELGTDAVGAGHQHRLAVLAGQVEQRAKPAQSAHHFRTEAALDQRFDALHQGIASVDVDTSITVGEGRVARSRTGHGGHTVRNNGPILAGRIGELAAFGHNCPLSAQE